MEIERKFLVRELPKDISTHEHFRIEQGYLCRKPVIRVRRFGSDYILTIKGEGLMAREEFELPLDAAAYRSLMDKCEGSIIRKTRYHYPEDGHMIDLDIFDSPRSGLIMAEVEFATEEEAMAYQPPEWFDTEVTNDPFYHNSNM